MTLHSREVFMLKAPRLFLCLNGRETYAYIPPEVVTRACEMDSLTYLRAYSPYILLLMFLLHMGIMNNRRKKTTTFNMSIPREIAQHDRSN